jgi:hypothetical protein
MDGWITRVISGNHDDVVTQINYLKSLIGIKRLYPEIKIQSTVGCKGFYTCKKVFPLQEL